MEPLAAPRKPLAYDSCRFLAHAYFSGVFARSPPTDAALHPRLTGYPTPAAPGGAPVQPVPRWSGRGSRSSRRRAVAGCALPRGPRAPVVHASRRRVARVLPRHLGPHPPYNPGARVEVVERVPAPRSEELHHPPHEGDGLAPGERATSAGRVAHEGVAHAGALAASWLDDDHLPGVVRAAGARRHTARLRPRAHPHARRAEGQQLLEGRRRRRQRPPVVRGLQRRDERPVVDLPRVGGLAPVVPPREARVGRSA